MATRGQGLFSLYIYIENFKILHVRNHWTYFSIACWPSTKIVKAFMICEKYGSQGRAYFPSVYIPYISV